MTPHPLDGSKLKIIRAKQHLDAFKSEVASFLDGKPYEIVSQVYGDHWWIKPRLLKMPPSVLSALVGDCVTNCRAPFDYVVWEMAQRHFRPPVDITQQSDRSILTFPILLVDPRRRQGHLDHLDRLTRRGMPSQAIDIIKSVQADTSGNHALQWIYELVNMDKHRSAILTLAIVRTAHIEISNFRGRNWMIRDDIIGLGIALRAERELLDFVREHPMDVKIQEAVFVTCVDSPVPDVPLDAMLEQIIECATDVVARFEVLF